MRLRGLLLFVALVCSVGACSSKPPPRPQAAPVERKPFLGYPEDRPITLGKDHNDPETHPLLRDVEMMSPVVEVPYGTYVELRRANRIVIWEEHPGVVYYMLQEPRRITLRDPGKTVPVTADIIYTYRFKASLPRG
jgi:hypothetical protein